MLKLTATGVATAALAACATAASSPPDHPLARLAGCWATWPMGPAQSPMSIKAEDGALSGVIFAPATLDDAFVKVAGFTLPPDGRTLSLTPVAGDAIVVTLPLAAPWSDPDADSFSVVYGSAGGASVSIEMTRQAEHWGTPQHDVMTFRVAGMAGLPKETALLMGRWSLSCALKADVAG